MVKHRSVRCIPKDFPVQPLKPGQKAQDKATCGHCGLSWDDAIITSYTPSPSARCPFEYYHMTTQDEATEQAASVITSDLIQSLRDILPYALSRLEDMAVVSTKDKYYREAYRKFIKAETLLVSLTGKKVRL